MPCRIETSPEDHSRRCWTCWLDGIRPRCSANCDPEWCGTGSTKTLTPRTSAHRLAVTNPGTIPDRGLYTVNLPDGGRIGELDEEMVYESRPGDVFVLGTTAWRITDITPTESRSFLPLENLRHGCRSGVAIRQGGQWKPEGIGQFVREMSAMDEDDARATLTERYHLDELVAANLISYFGDERAATGVLPTDQTIVVERFRDEIGDWRIAILSPLGARVSRPVGDGPQSTIPRALRADRRCHLGATTGIAFRFVDADEVPTLDDLILDPDELEPMLMEELADTAIFAARFREAAARALLLPRRRPGGRMPLWLQRRRSADLMDVAKEFGSFPIVLEVYREILQDTFDLPALTSILTDVRSRAIRVVEVETTSASPFASSSAVRVCGLISVRR